MGLKVLVADDNAVMRKILRANLEKIENIELKLFYAADGKKAIQSLLHEHFDLIFLDLNMPHFSGFDISNYVKSKEYEAKIIVISSELTDENINIFKSLGVKYFLQKPFNIQNFQTVAIPVISDLAKAKNV
jgi:CheY-like chemotaxis protein